MPSTSKTADYYRGIADSRRYHICLVSSTKVETTNGNGWIIQARATADYVAGLSAGGCDVVRTN